jgi:hypothetical protein
MLGMPKIPENYILSTLFFLKQKKNPRDAGKASRGFFSGLPPGNGQILGGAGH